AGRDRDGVGRVARGADGADRLGADRVADVDELEVARVDAADRLAEGDGPAHARRIRRARGVATDRDDRRGRLVDDDRLTGEVAVAGSGSAELVADAVCDRVVVDEVEPQRSATRAGRDGDGVGRARTTRGDRDDALA